MGRYRRGLEVLRLLLWCDEEDGGPATEEDDGEFKILIGVRPVSRPLSARRRGEPPGFHLARGPIRHRPDLYKAL